MAWILSLVQWGTVEVLEAGEPCDWVSFRKIALCEVLRRDGGGVEQRPDQRQGAHLGVHCSGPGKRRWEPGSGEVLE